MCFKKWVLLVTICKRRQSCFVINVIWPSESVSRTVISLFPSMPNAEIEIKNRRLPICAIWRTFCGQCCHRVLRWVWIHCREKEKKTEPCMSAGKKKLKHECKENRQDFFLTAQEVKQAGLIYWVLVDAEGASLIKSKFGKLQSTNTLLNIWMYLLLPPLIKIFSNRKYLLTHFFDKRKHPNETFWRGWIMAIHEYSRHFKLRNSRIQLKYEQKSLLHDWAVSFWSIIYESKNFWTVRLKH